MLNLILRTHKLLQNIKFSIRKRQNRPVCFLDFGRQSVPAQNAWRLPLLSFRDRLFCCISFVLLRQNLKLNQRRFAILPHTRDRFLTKSGQFNGGLHARLHKNGWRSKIQKTDGLILVLSHRKFDILESFLCSQDEV